MKIIFTGDVYLQDSATRIDAGLQKLTKEAGQVFINLEAPIAADGLLPRKKAGPHLKQDAEGIKKLCREMSVTILGGANNHLMDYGLDGLTATERFAKENRLRLIGCGQDLAQAQKPFLTEDGTCAVFAVCEEEFGIAEKQEPGSYSLYDGGLVSAIQEQSKQGRKVIIYAHGGGELIPLPSPYIKKRYHELIDAGAGLVIGHHPHVTQGIEQYNGRTIVYSLGNLNHQMFDQTWGLIAVVTAEKGRPLALELIPIQTRDTTVSIVTNPQPHLKLLIELGRLYGEEEDYATMLQTQAVVMYEEYYQSYFRKLFEPIVSWRRALLNLLTGRTNKARSMKTVSDELTLFHLFRNRSHRDFIQTALAVRTGEVPTLVTPESRTRFDELRRQLIDAPHE